MEKRLFDLVEIVCNNAECVVLKVKKNAFMDLVCLGCFDGTETMFRLTKGSSHTVTVWRGEKSFSWEFGNNGTTIVSDNLHKQRELIVDCVVGDFGIAIEGNGIEKTLCIKSKKTRLSYAIFKEMWWENETKRCVHLNGEFLKHFASHDNFIDWLGEKDWKIISQNNTAANGCLVNEITCER